MEDGNRAVLWQHQVTGEFIVMQYRHRKMKEWNYRRGVCLWDEPVFTKPYEWNYIGYYKFPIKRDGEL